MARLVREARTAERMGDHDLALRSFDAALRLVPGQPRVLCEAGFVAHRAGRDALAAERIETALRVFGPPGQVSEALRVPLAMCLYNAGLVDEARADDAGAVEHFEASLALRDHDVVRAALERARGADAPDARADAETVAGFAWDGERLAAPTEDDLVRALRVGLAGFDDFAARRQAAETTEVRVREHVEGPVEIVLLSVLSADYPLSTERLVIARRVAGGYLLTAVDTGGADETDHGSWGGGTLDDVEASWLEGGLLQLALSSSGESGTMDETPGPSEDIACYETIAATSSSERIVLCRTSEGLSCVSLDVELRQGAETRTVSCDDGTEETDEPGPESVSRTELTVSASGIEVTRRTGPMPIGPELGRASWAELDGRYGASISLLTDGELEAEADDVDDGEE